jgi:pimeloyl-ACP methyl ester carboxylesterase
VIAYKPAALVADVLRVADACGFERFDLVGHDFGGMVAWMVAGHHPDRLRTLTVASTPHPAAFKASYQRTSDQNERSGYMRSFRAAARGEVEAQLLADDAAGLRSVYVGLDPDAIDDYVAVLSQPGAMVAAIDWYRSMSGAASEATPPASMPTLYVWSDQDPSLGRDAAEATAAFVTGPYRFEVLTGVGHWIPELATDVFTPMLLDHLAQATIPPGGRCAGDPGRTRDAGENAMRVLLIDDEPDLRDLLAITLELDGGFDVVGNASSLTEGVELARTTRPDVIVTDLVLGSTVPPEELLGELRAAAPQAAVVVFSGRDVGVTPPVGADAAVLKGGDLAALIDKLKEVGRRLDP